MKIIMPILIALIIGLCILQFSASGQTNGLPPYSPTPTDWILGGGDPSAIFGMRLIESSGRTNAAVGISVRPVLSFSNTVHEGWTEAFYGLYSTDSLTNEWRSLKGWWADGSRVDYIEWSGAPQRFYVLTTIQMVVLDTMPPTPTELGYAPPEGPPTLPPVPGETTSTNDVGGASMIWDHRRHKFDNCPMCRGLAIWLNHNAITPSEANRLQAREAIDWIDSHPELGIHVTRKERRRAA